jgi:hypothetical protein
MNKIKRTETKSYLKDKRAFKKVVLAIGDFMAEEVKKTEKTGQSLVFKAIKS